MMMMMMMMAPSSLLLLLLLQAEAFGLLKRVHLDGIFTPKAPRHREWKSLDEVRRHFKARLKRFDTDCLEDFVVSRGRRMVVVVVDQ